MKINRLSKPSDTFDVGFADDKSHDVVGFGENSVDHVCVVAQFPGFDTKSEILQHELLAGGQVATALVFLARMGLGAKYIGKVGSDEPGRISLESLRSERIDTSSVITVPGSRNRYAFIIIERQSGERTILWERDARLSFGEAELRREDVCAGRVLYIDGVDQPAALRAASWAQEDGIPVIVDLDRVRPGCEQLLRHIDFLIVSSNFPPDFTGIADPVDSLLALRRHCDGFIVMTLGARGAMAVLEDSCISFPAFKIQAIDTTGAGDVFRGAFVYGLLQNWPLEKMMTFANAAAGLNCTRLGAQAGIHALDNILQLAGSSEGHSRQEPLTG